MGYRAEKLAIEEKIKRIKRIVLFIVVGIVMSLCIFSAFIPAETWKYHVAKPKISKRLDGELRLHFLNVGQGDCSLIEFPDGKIMLVDGGDASSKTEKTILRYLNALKIEKIDYLLLTHSDVDHCGSLDKVVKYKKIGKAYIPKVLEDINTQYSEFYAELIEKGCSTSFSSKSIAISSDRADCPYTLSFLYPYTSDVNAMDKLAENTNAYSSVFWLDYFGASALFTGDAPTNPVEEKLKTADELSLNAENVCLTSTEILKVAHHGSEDSSSTEFLQYLNVETAVISCAKDNPYGHPSENLCERLKENGIKDYRTYQDGHIIITIDKMGDYKVDCIAF